MNKINQLLVVIMLTLVSTVSFAQKNVEEITIQSSIQCEMCENRLNQMFADLNGVQEVDYNLDDQTITVVYNSKKVDPQEIKENIANSGYDADDVEASIDAYVDLPKCCQKKPTDKKAQATHECTDKCEHSDSSCTMSSDDASAKAGKSCCKKGSTDCKKK